MDTTQTNQTNQTEASQFFKVKLVRTIRKGTEENPQPKAKGEGLNVRHRFSLDLPARLLDNQESQRKLAIAGVEFLAQDSLQQASRTQFLDSNKLAIFWEDFKQALEFNLDSLLAPAQSRMAGDVMTSDEFKNAGILDALNSAHYDVWSKFMIARNYESIEKMEQKLPMALLVLQALICTRKDTISTGAGKSVKFDRALMSAVYFECFADSKRPETITQETWVRLNNKLASLVDTADYTDADL